MVQSTVPPLWVFLWGQIRAGALAHQSLRTVSEGARREGETQLYPGNHDRFPSHRHVFPASLTPTLSQPVHPTHLPSLSIPVWQALRASGSHPIHTAQVQPPLGAGHRWPPPLPLFLRSFGRDKIAGDDRFCFTSVKTHEVRQRQRQRRE